MRHISSLLGLVGIALVLALSCWTGPANALSVALPPMKQPPPQWLPPTVSVSTQGMQSVHLRRVDLRTEIFAGQARTQVEMVLFNPNGRVLEGELQFPLQEGQTVTGFALDVNGQMREAAAVPKAKGQEIFEDIRRRRVDPGLLETTANNQYKLRVYPIPANGERRVRLTVMETLANAQSAKGKTPATVQWRWPMVFSSPVETLNVSVEVIGQARDTVQMVRGPAGTNVAEQWNGTRVSLVKRQWAGSPRAAEWLQLAIAHTDKPQVLVSEWAGTRYFTGQLAFKDEPVRRPAPKHLALVWDASGSSAAQQRVLPALDAYFRSLPGPVRVSLLVVRNQVEPVRSFSAGPQSWGELADALRAEAHDGSSNLDNLPIPSDADTTLMVTDGLMTDGQRLLNYTHTAPVLVLNGSATADVPRLRQLAERTGGAYADTTTLTPQEAIAPLLWHGWRIASLHSLAATQLVAPQASVQAGRLSLAGVLDDASARVELRLKHPSGRTRTLVLEVRGDKPTQDRWPAQQWATWRSVQLAENPQLHSAQLQKLVAMHGLVGPNSSLIVLEQAADYVRYELPAPAELEAEVARLQSAGLAQRTQTRKAHMETMVAQFAQRQTWWDTDFAARALELAKPPPASAQVALGNAAPQQPAPPIIIPRAAPASVPAPAAMPAPPAPLPSVAPRAAPPPPPPAPAAVAAAPARPQSLQSDSGARKETATSTASTISLQAWQPNAPYLKRLQSTASPALYGVYLDERVNHAQSSAFYLDVASLFMERGQQALGLRILSNLAEMNLENRQLLRLYGYRLTQAGRGDLAAPVFARVGVLAPNEPQSWRDLGLALAEIGKPQEAVDALWEVVSKPWNTRFEGAAMIALAELNAIAATANARSLGSVSLSHIDPRLVRNLPLDLRVTLAWDTDDTDIDLWVTDPKGEKASYSNRLTSLGGAMSPDARGGYGPEEFALKQAAPGTYILQAEFFGDRQQVLTGGTTVMVRVSTAFGTPQWKDQWMTLRLNAGREIARVGEVIVEKRQGP